MASKLRLLRPSTGAVLKRLLSTQKGPFILSKAVGSALRNGEPVVALESTIITHGMPFPHNLETAKLVESLIKEKGATPATIAVIKGQVFVGLEDGVLDELSSHKNTVKISRRDLPFAVAKGLSGGTTVAGTMMIAHAAGIPIFVTGGIGGVHRQGETTLDISADLTELGRTPVAVICAGVKSVLDIGRTLEYLETQGVCVATLDSRGKSYFPSFFSRESPFMSPMCVRTHQEAAQVISANLQINRTNGVLLAVPIPQEHSLDNAFIEDVIKKALCECKERGISGKEVTPFILEKVNQLTRGKSLEANKALIANNAVAGACIAAELSVMRNKANHGYNSEVRPVVIGGSNFDIICKVSDPFSTSSSTAGGKIRTCFGGVGRNLADALARLDCNPLFISAVGNDHLGQCLLSHNSQLDKSLIRVMPDLSTATYCLTLGENGALNLGIGDMDIHNAISPSIIMKHKDVIEAASIVVLDANFSQETIDTILELCYRASVPVFFEPTDPQKGRKAVNSAFAKAIKYMSPNIHELRLMARGQDNNTPFALEECLALGGDLMASLPSLTALIITLVQPEENVVSVSGAGDSLAAGFIAGVLDGLSLDQSLMMGLRAAKMSLQTTDAIPSSLCKASIVD